MKHIPVLLQESIDSLAIHKGGIYVDATLGAGGHASAIIDRLAQLGGGTLIGFDQDPISLDRATASIRAHISSLVVTEPIKFVSIRGNFRHIATHLREQGIVQVHGILADLGYSSDQLAHGYGLSFQVDEELSMALSPETKATAYEAVNTWSESSLADIIYGFGEETRSRKIAKAIVSEREVQSIRTTRQLADLIERIIPRRGSRIHPATRTFQALRIAINDELGALKDFLPQAFDTLFPQGRLSVITFHSLEDRIVKRVFRELQTQDRGVCPCGQYMRASEAERMRNPRSRSALLRVIEKI